MSNTTSNKDEKNQSQLSSHSSDSEVDNTLYNQESEIDAQKGTFLKNKRETLFKLHKNGSGDLFNTSNASYSYLNRRLDKLSKNRISAKKCRLKKKEYVVSLENKLRQLHKKVDSKQINEYSQADAFQSFLKMTMPIKLRYLSQAFFSKTISLSSKQSIEEYFNGLNDIRMTIEDGTDKGKEFGLLFDLYIHQLKECINGLNDYTENNHLLNKLYP